MTNRQTALEAMKQQLRASFRELARFEDGGLGLSRQDQQRRAAREGFQHRLMEAFFDNLTREDVSLFCEPVDIVSAVAQVMVVAVIGAEYGRAEARMVLEGALNTWHPD